VDEFDTEHGGNENYFGKITIAGMILLSHHYISKAGNISKELKENFKNHFPMLKPSEWYHIANEIRAFYLGYDINSAGYKVMLNKYNEQYKQFKELNNKYNDLKI
jgi:hypothetical protein